MVAGRLQRQGHNQPLHLVAGKLDHPSRCRMSSALGKRDHHQEGASMASVTPRYHDLQRRT
jgi:hypothetical protein